METGTGEFNKASWVVTSEFNRWEDVCGGKIPAAKQVILHINDLTKKYGFSGSDRKEIIETLYDLVGDEGDFQHVIENMRFDISSRPVTAKAKLILQAANMYNVNIGQKRYNEK